MSKYLCVVEDESVLDARKTLRIATMDRTGFSTGKKTVVIAGYLLKQNLWKQWKTRFFVLEDCGRLNYFKSESERLDPEQAIGCVPISLEARVKQHKSKDGTLLISMKGRDFRKQSSW